MRKMQGCVGRRSCSGREVCLGSPSGMAGTVFCRAPCSSEHRVVPCSMSFRAPCSAVLPHRPQKGEKWALWSGGFCRSAARGVCRRHWLPGVLPHRPQKGEKWALWQGRCGLWIIPSRQSILRIARKLCWTRNAAYGFSC